MTEPLRVEDIISQIFVYVSTTCFLAFLIMAGARWEATGNPFPLELFDGVCLIISLILAFIGFYFYKLARKKNREEEDES